MSNDVLPSTGVRRAVPASPAGWLLAGLLAVPAIVPEGARAGDGARLLTGLAAEAGPAGVVLNWTVDERRAERIAGFACAYRTPAHLRLGATGAVPCPGGPSPAGMRTRTVVELPEYGEYLFEVVALAAPGSAVAWPLRALDARVAVTAALAGPPGPDRAVSGAGPQVESCAPEEPAGRAWRRAEQVSAGHLTHYPGRGWRAGGDAAAPWDWPEAPALPALFAETGLDPAPLQAAMAGAGVDPAAMAAMLADARFETVLARAAAGTRALLRTRADGARVLRLHTSYPFGADYLFEARHAVAGWSDAGHTAGWPGLWRRSECPPPGRPAATHDVALALSTDAGSERRLAHAGYGWWTVAPVGLMPGRVLAAKAGLSFGAPAPDAPAAGMRWRGRVSGHLFHERRRYMLAADIALELRPGGLTGSIANLVLAPLDERSLRPGAAFSAVDGRALALYAALATEDGSWSGTLELTDAWAGLPGPDGLRGDWRAEAHGPGAAEIAGRLRLWTPLPAGVDPTRAWPDQAVLAAGFGAARAL